jgi:hypothetical protein
MSTETLTYDFSPMTGLFMLAFSFALNTDTQKPHTHVFTSHMVVIVHHVAGKDMCGPCDQLYRAGQME